MIKKILLVSIILILVAGSAIAEVKEIHKSMGGQDMGADSLLPGEKIAFEVQEFTGKVTEMYFWLYDLDINTRAEIFIAVDTPENVVWRKTFLIHMDFKYTSIFPNVEIDGTLIVGVMGVSGLAGWQYLLDARPYPFYEQEQLGEYVKSSTYQCPSAHIYGEIDVEVFAEIISDGVIDTYDLRKERVRLSTDAQPNVINPLSVRLDGVIYYSRKPNLTYYFRESDLLDAWNIKHLTNGTQMAKTVNLTGNLYENDKPFSIPLTFTIQSDCDITFIYLTDAIVNKKNFEKESIFFTSNATVSFNTMTFGGAGPNKISRDSDGTTITWNESNLFYRQDSEVRQIGNGERMTRELTLAGSVGGKPFTSIFTITFTCKDLSQPSGSVTATAKVPVPTLVVDPVPNDGFKFPIFVTTSPPKNVGIDTESIIVEGVKIPTNQIHMDGITFEIRLQGTTLIEVCEKLDLVSSALFRKQSLTIEGKCDDPALHFKVESESILVWDIAD